LFGKPLGFASMLDAHGGVIGIHAAIAQININVTGSTNMPRWISEVGRLTATGKS
jgi:hypothetical protein